MARVRRAAAAGGMLNLAPAWIYLANVARLTTDATPATFLRGWPPSGAV